MLIKGIHHISLKCDQKEEFEQAKDFYENVLGLNVVLEWPDGVMLDTGSGIVEIFSNGKGIREKGAIQHVAFATDHVDELAEQIKNAGYDVFIAPNDRIIPSDLPFPLRMAFCKGPLGEEIELFCAKLK